MQGVLRHSRSNTHTARSARQWHHTTGKIPHLSLFWCLCLATVYSGVYDNPLGLFFMLDISTVGIVSVSERSALDTPHRELSEDVSFSISILLVVEQSSLENRLRGL